MRHFLIASVCGLAGLLTGIALMSFQPWVKGKTSSHIAHAGELERPVTADANAFRLVPCGSSAAPHHVLSPCLLVLAGGKRLLFGAPPGHDWRGIGRLDGVFLFDGRPESSGGLVGLRYETWSEGRDDLLLLVTGELMVDTVQALDSALYVPDALLQLERPADLDARRAGFSPKPVPPDDMERIVFDTGDLKVFASGRFNPSGDQLITYRVAYQGRSVELLSCGGESHTEARIDTRVQPVIEQAELTRLLRTAREEKLDARAAELRRAGKICPGLSEATKSALEDGVSDLVILDGGKPSSAMRVTEGKIMKRVLTPDGILFDLS